MAIKINASNTLLKIKSDYDNFKSNLANKATQVRSNFNNFVSDAGSKAKIAVRDFVNTPVRVSPATKVFVDRMATATPTKIAAPAVKAFQDWKAKPMGPISTRLQESGVLNPIKIGKQLLQKMAPADMGQKFTRDFTPIIGQQASEDIGYGIEGALDLTPQRWISMLDKDYRTKLKESAPTTDRQKKAERIGRTLYGTILVAPLGGPNPIVNTISRAGQGALLNTGIDTVKTIVSEGRLPTIQELGESGIQGVENSWILAFTNLGTDLILGGMGTKIPALNRIVGSNTTAPLRILGNANLMNLSSPLKKEILKVATFRLFSRALAEVPLENTMFTAIEGLNPGEKAEFAQRWADNFWGTVVGNMAFAGVQTLGGGTYNWNKTQIDTALKAMWKTMTDIKPGFARLDLGFGDTKVKPIDLKNQDITFTKTDIVNLIKNMPEFGQSKTVTYDGENLVFQGEKGSFKMNPYALIGPAAESLKPGDTINVAAALKDKGNFPSLSTPVSEKPVIGGETNTAELNKVIPNTVKFGTDIDARTKIQEDIWASLNNTEKRKIAYEKYIGGKATNWETQRKKLQGLVLNMQNETGDLLYVQKNGLPESLKTPLVGKTEVAQKAAPEDIGIKTPEEAITDASLDKELAQLDAQPAMEPADAIRVQELEAIKELLNKADDIQSKNYSKKADAEIKNIKSAAAKENSELKKVGRELGGVRKQLKTVTDPGARETLIIEEARLRKEYARLKGFTPGAQAEMAGARVRPTPAQAPVKVWSPLAKLKTKINSILYPIKNLSGISRIATHQLDAGYKLSQIEANATEARFKEISTRNNIDPKTEWKLIQYSQEPTKEMADLLVLKPEEITNGKELIDAHRKFNDQIFEEAKKAGIDIDYLKNHVLQVYQQSGTEIKNRIKVMGLSATPGFAKERVIDSYWEAMHLRDVNGNDISLTPKFTTFGQINAEMQNQLGKAMANQNYVDALKADGKIKPANKADDNWMPITAPGFPTATIKISKNKSIQLPYKADPETANFLNNLLGGQEQGVASKALQVISDVSRLHQQVKLSSPGPVNSFTLSQIFKDVATGIGEIITLKPRMGVTRIANDLTATLRWFIPGAGQKFDVTHADTIKEMAGEGFQYSGGGDYRSSRKNIIDVDGALQKAVNVGKNVWNAVMENPTFKNMMHQRRIGQFEMYRDTFVRGGMDRPTAIKMAGDALKNYDGMADSLGRSQDLENGLTIFLLAPKYREGVIGSLVNIPKGFLNLRDKTFASSRALGIGLVATYLIYDQINQYYNNGKHLSENPKGKEFSLVIPKNTLDPSADPNQYWHFPWMPGYTATPRAAYIGGKALLQGDTLAAGKEFGKFGSTLLQTAREVNSGEDYFGREIFNPNEPRLPQQIKYAGTSFLPQFMKEPGKYLEAEAAGQNPSLPVSIARGFEIPIKEGKFSSQYFDARDDVLKGQDKKTQEGYTFLHPTKEAWETTAAVDQSGASTSEQDRMTKANVRLQNPNIFMVEKEIAIKSGEMLGKEVDPLYIVPMEVSMRYLRYQSLPIGNADKKSLGKMYPEIYELAAARSDFFKRNPMPNQTGPNRPIPTERAQKLMDAGNWTDPEVQAYLNANEIYTNQEREKLGLPPLAGYGDYGPKKITVKKSSAISGKKSTPKLGPSAKTKSITIKFKTIKPPTTSIKALKGGYSGYEPAKIKVAPYKRLPLTLRGLGNA